MAAPSRRTGKWIVRPAALEALARATSVLRRTLLAEQPVPIAAVRVERGRPSAVDGLVSVSERTAGIGLLEAIGAASIPVLLSAHRAAALDPIEALRADGPGPSTSTRLQRRIFRPDRHFPPSACATIPRARLRATRSRSCWPNGIYDDSRCMPRARHRPSTDPHEEPVDDMRGRGSGHEAALAQLRSEHRPEVIRRRLAAGPRHSYLRDFLFGAVDGAVTTFAVVAGVEGAGLSSGIVLVLGLANLLGDGFSMAVGNFLAVRSEREQRERTRETELEHIRRLPEGEREEVRQIFARKGFRGAELDAVVARITADVGEWVETMLREEHGLSPESPSPRIAARTTFVAFVFVGSIPLLAFLPAALGRGELLAGGAFPWSAALTALAFFAVGAAKARFVSQPWWASGLETTAVGGLAAGIAYGVGALLRTWISLPPA